MKKLLLPLLLFCASCSNEPTGWKDFNLNGKVKSVAMTSHEVTQKFGEWVIEEDLYEGCHKYIFDKNGAHIGYEYLSSGELYAKGIYRKIDGGNQLFMYDSDGKLTQKTISKKISKNETLTEDFNEKDELISSTKWSYEKDKNSFDYKSITTDKDGTIREYTQHAKLDKNSNVIDEKTQIKDNDYYKKYEYIKYDEKRNWIERLVYTAEDAKEPSSLETREIEYY